MHAYLQRYCLGDLDPAAAELIEEEAVVNDEVASLLCRVENDLVDAYVRGRLAGEVLDRFETFYLASPRRRAKVDFAVRLLRLIDRQTPL